MKAKTLYEEGRLDEAIAALGGELRDNPGDAQRRTFLFELLSFAGEYDRAAKQLDVIARQDRESEMFAWMYRGALMAQKERSRMFESGELPGQGKDLPPVSGTLNGNRFESIEDADPRIGARLEVIVAGQYVWLPLGQMEQVRVSAPERLRDLMWARGWVKSGPGFKGMDLGEVLIPSLTPLAWKHADGAVRLGRDWGESDDSAAPVGQKLFVVDGEAFPFLEVRDLQIDPPVVTDE